MTNTQHYDKLKKVPTTALKPIEFGNLKGKSDINPQWRIEAMTEEFGPCGIGWKYEIVNHFTQPAPSETLMIFVNINLYIKEGEEWSAPIPGNGGDFLIIKDKNGIHGNDEAYKMALTDALGNAMKMIGVAADVYRGLANDSKYGREPAPSQKQTSQAPEPEPKPKVIKVSGTTKLLTQKGYVSISTIEKATLQKMYDSGYYKEANAEIEKVLGVLSKSDQEVLDNI
jgi:hypothetical protein